jgi:hypothetical protein
MYRPGSSLSRAKNNKVQGAAGVGIPLRNVFILK